MKLVLLDSDLLEDIPFDILHTFGELTVYSNTEENEITERIEGNEIVITCKTPLKRKHLERTTTIKFIAIISTGYDHIDIEYCKERNIGVSNVRGYSTHSVAQQTFALLLELYNRTSLFNQYIQNGNYCQSSHNQQMSQSISSNMHEIYGKIWTICGLGSIGKQVAIIAQAFGANVRYYSTSGKHFDSDITQVTFDEMITESDIISIHCPSNEYTRQMFSYNILKQMKSSSVIINVARGDIVVCKDMVKVLNDNIIAGYATDVFDKEPIEDNNLYLSVNPSKIVMTPHIGWACQEAKKRLMDEVVLNIEAFLKNIKRNRIV